MLVSRFFQFPIQINFAENVLAHQNPLDHIGDLSGPGGYMKGGTRNPPRGALGLCLGRLQGVPAAATGVLAGR